MLILLSLVGAAAAAQQAGVVPIATFVRSPLPGLFVSDEVLFEVDDDEHSCVGPVGMDGVALDAISVVGYARPQTIGRFCLDASGVFRSPHTSRDLRATTVKPAPSWAELVASIEEDPRRCLPSERGLLFEAVELLCFGLGYKPLVLRQRQASAGGAATAAALLGAPAALFSPHAQKLLAFLLARVWVGESRNEWGAHNFFEETLVLARDSHVQAGRRLVEVGAQDASVPGQPNDDAKALFIAEVGRLLGYPEPDVRAYILDDMIPGYPKVDAALETAVLRATALLDDDDLGRFVVGAAKFPEIPGFRDFLFAMPPLNADSLRDLIRPLDFLFRY